ncbi:MAG TPA: caspase family protein [Gammaproteobacteria bacterium]
MSFKFSISLLFLTQCLLIATPFTAAAENTRGIALQAVEQKATTPSSQGVYRALIIGNNNYNDQDGLWKPLKTAVSDARAVKNLLESSYGFSDIKVLENATRRDVLQAFESLSQKVLPDDHVLVYYAGHGFMEMETNRGYWVPVDAKGKDNTTFLRNSTIRDELTTIASRAKHTLLISDSCFSGSLLRRGTRGAPDASNSEQYYKKVANKKSVQIMTAGGVEYVDDKYQSSDHSPFTYFLINELKNNDRPMLTLSELSTNVEKAVANNVDQVPESGVLQGAGDELGEFIFIKMDLVVDGVPADKVKVQINVKQADDSQHYVKPDRPATETKNKRKKILPVPTL